MIQRVPSIRSVRGRKEVELTVGTFIIWYKECENGSAWNKNTKQCSLINKLLGGFPQSA